MEVCSSGGSLLDLSWVLVMISQSNRVEKVVKELFAKENRNNFFNLVSTIFLFLEKKEEEY
jgi:hypothetical protein